MSALMNELTSEISTKISNTSGWKNAVAKYRHMDEAVRYKLNVRNYSNHVLELHKHKTHTGFEHDAAPTVSISPGTQEAMIGYNEVGTSTGCSGTVSWLIGDTGLMLVVMYSIPYDHNLHSNWLGIGIFSQQATDSFFDTMYYEAEVGFKRKEFYYNVHTLYYQPPSNLYVVSATCGRNCTAEIEVDFAPTNKDGFAESLK